MGPCIVLPNISSLILYPSLSPSSTPSHLLRESKNLWFSCWHFVQTLVSKSLSCHLEEQKNTRNQNADSSEGDARLHEFTDTAYGGLYAVPCGERRWRYCCPEVSTNEACLTCPECPPLHALSPWHWLQVASGVVFQQTCYGVVFQKTCCANLTHGPSPAAHLPLFRGSPGRALVLLDFLSGHLYSKIREEQRQWESIRERLRETENQRDKD